MDILPTNEWDMVRSYDTDKTYDSIFAVAVDLLIRSKICSMKETGFYEKNIPLLRGGFVILCLSGILFLISFVMSGLMAGRKRWR